MEVFIQRALEKILQASSKKDAALRECITTTIGRNSLDFSQSLTVSIHQRQTAVMILLSVLLALALKFMFFRVACFDRCADLIESKIKSGAVRYSRAAASAESCNSCPYKQLS